MGVLVNSPLSDRPEKVRQEKKLFVFGPLGMDGLGKSAANHVSKLSVQNSTNYAAKSRLLVSHRNTAAP